MAGPLVYRQIRIPTEALRAMNYARLTLTGGEPKNWFLNLRAFIPWPNSDEMNEKRKDRL